MTDLKNPPLFLNPLKPYASMSFRNISH